MKYDEIYDHIGHAGVFQLCAVTAACLVAMFDSEPTTMVFVGGSMDHFCKVDRLSNFSYDQQRQISIPWNEDKNQYDQCSVFDIDYDNYTDDELIDWNRTEFIWSHEGQVKVKKCEEWNYIQNTYVSTIVKRYSLVCDGRKHLPALTSTLYMVGGLIGALLAGMVSDRYGRKVSVLVFMCVRITGALIFLVAPSYAVFAFGKFLLGVGGNGNRSVIYALAAEVVGPRYRTLCMGLVQIVACTANSGSALMAYFIRDDLDYQIAFFSPYLLVLISTAIILPESPRWLFATKRYDRLNEELEFIAATNNRTLPPNFDSRKFETVKSVSSGKKVNVTTVFRSSAIRKRTLVVLASWFTGSLVYFSIILNAGTLPGNVFMNTAIIGALGIPGNFIGLFMCRTKFIGRRYTSIIGQVGVSVCNFITIPLVLYGFETAKTVLSFISKIFLSAGAAAMVVYTSELFPTEVRNVAMGVAMTASRMGSVISPYMGTAMADVWKPLPCVIMGILTAICGGLYILMPETLGRPICDTIEEIKLQSAQAKQLQLPPGEQDTALESKTTNHATNGIVAKKFFKRQVSELNGKIHSSTDELIETESGAIHFEVGKKTTVNNTIPLNGLTNGGYNGYIEMGKGIENKAFVNCPAIVLTDSTNQSCVLDVDAYITGDDPYNNEDTSGVKISNGRSISVNLKEASTQTEWCESLQVELEAPKPIKKSRSYEDIILDFFNSAMQTEEVTCF